MFCCVHTGVNFLIHQYFHTKLTSARQELFPHLGVHAGSDYCHEALEYLLWSKYLRRGHSSPGDTRLFAATRPRSSAWPWAERSRAVGRLLASIGYHSGVNSLSRPPSS